MAKLENPADALPLLAYKIAPRQFDLSYRFSNISLRDQIVRGQTLVRTLISTGLAPKKTGEPECDFELLICGAGAAGLAAAAEAAALGISFVLIEKGKHVPGGVLRSKAERYVSTGMYEWPHPNHAHHAFPLATPVLLGTDAHPLPSLQLPLGVPKKISDFGASLRTALEKPIKAWGNGFYRYQKGRAASRVLIRNAQLCKNTKKALRKLLARKTSIHGVPLNEVELPLIQLVDGSGKPVTKELQFRYVIYAVGFADEVKNYADKKPVYEGFKHTPFWEPDSIFKPALGFKKIHEPSVAILGSGDGALQDTLRCLVVEKFPQALAIWNHLMDFQPKGGSRLGDSPFVHAALARITAADCYTTGGAVWTYETHIFQSLDVAFKSIIDDLYVKEKSNLDHALQSMMRQDVGKLTLVTQWGYFSKAYALNRFLVLLFDKVLAGLENSSGVQLEILAGEVTQFTRIGRNRRGAHLEIACTDGANVSRNCDLVILRGGLNWAESPSQLLGLTDLDTGRAELGRIPAPIRPVSIHSGHQ